MSEQECHAPAAGYLNTRWLCYKYCRTGLYPHADDNQVNTMQGQGIHVAARRAQLKVLGAAIKDRFRRARELVTADRFGRSRQQQHNTDDVDAINRETIRTLSMQGGGTLQLRRRDKTYYITKAIH